MTFLRAALVAASLLVFASPASAQSTSQAALLKEMNRVRAAHGLQALSFDPVLARAAVAHSRSMAATGVFEHGSFRTRMLQFRVRGPFVGENLAWGNGTYASPATVISEWLRSPEHRANLLRPGFTRIGIGATQGTFLGTGGATVMTADFAGH